MIQLKVLLSLVLAFVFFPILSMQYAAVDFLKIDFISAAAREVMVGLCLGFLTRVFFYAVSAAGELISTSLGLASAAIFNPMMGSQGTVVEKFYYTLAVLLFLAINGHHQFIEVILKSFELFPLDRGLLHFENFAQVALIGQEVLLLAIKMSAPIMVAILVANLAMGILGRAVPQINVLVTSFSVTIIVGLGLLIITLPLMFGQMIGLMQWNFEFLYKFLEII